MSKESIFLFDAMNHHTLSAITLALLLSLPAAAAQKKLPPAIKLVSPVATDEQKGVIEVRIRTEIVGKSAPSSVYASLGGSPGIKMTRIGDSDEWGCQIDTTRTPNGGQQLRVITEKKSVLAVPLTVNNPLRHYFADLHSHTSYSDGTLLPEIAHDYARNVAKLDVFSLTDHLESVDAGEWNRMQEVAWKANEDGAFVVLPGLEWTKSWGHINIFDPGTRTWPTDPRKFYEAIAAAGVVAKFNHPGDGTKSHAGLEYSEAGDKAIQLMEVRNATEEKAFIRALGLGWHIAPDGSDDTHSPNWGNVRTWTGILAPGSIP